MPHWEERLREIEAANAKRLADITQRNQARLDRIVGPTAAEPDTRRDQPPVGRQRGMLPLLQGPEALAYDIPPAYIEHVKERVFGSDVVRLNMAYAVWAKRTNLQVINDDRVNAYATAATREAMARDEQIGPELAAQIDPRLEPPFILIFTGLCRAVQTIALCIASADAEHPSKLRDDARSTLRHAGQLLMRHDGMFPPKAAAELATAKIAPQHPGTHAALQHLACQIALGSLTVITAHELGHLCMAHILGGSRPMEVVLTEEREADLFATKILMTSPDREFAALGGALFWLFLSWTEQGASRSAEPRSHPRSRERLAHFARDHAEYLAAWGVDGEYLINCLPPLTRA